MTKYIKFNFIDETFGENVECILMWNNEIFVITVIDKQIVIKRYESSKELLKEFISNREELEFLRGLTQDLEKEIEELQNKLNEKKTFKG
ncbi:MAG: hypothetical protein Q4G09_04085 [Clostridia bacterium]|nr:hypothetical protein [Clostridia bacterium]